MSYLKGWHGVGLIIGAYLLYKNMHSGAAGKSLLSDKGSLTDTINNTWKTTQAAIGTSVSNFATTTVNNIQQTGENMINNQITATENNITQSLNNVIKPAETENNTNINKAIAPDENVNSETLDKLPLTIDNWTLSSWSHEKDYRTVSASSSCLKAGNMIVALTKKSNNNTVYMTAYEVKKTIDAQRKYIKERLEKGKKDKLISNMKFSAERNAVNESGQALDSYVDKNWSKIEEQAKTNKFKL